MTIPLVFYKCIHCGCVHRAANGLAVTGRQPEVLQACTQCDAREFSRIEAPAGFDTAAYPQIVLTGSGPLQVRPVAAAKAAMQTREEDEFLAHWKEPALFSHATEEAHLVRQMQDFVGKREAEPRLQMVLHGSTLTDAEIDNVLNADERHTAASQLIAAKLDRLG